MKAKKESVFAAAIKLVPPYVEFLRELQRGGGRISFTPEVANIQNNLGNYVVMYGNELMIGGALSSCILGEEGYREFVAQINAAPAEEQQEFLEEIADFENCELYKYFDDFHIPESPQEWKAAREALEQLPAGERAEVEKRGAYFWGFYFSSFFNTLALMVHGSKMTSLVPRALEGDEEAFLKAVQIDRMLLIHHPYFRDRKFRAQNEGHSEFMSKLAYRESNPPLRGKIQYPGLYMLFGILESFQWLSDLKHEEILDICDEAGLDRYQNRIEDVNYLTKRLIEYRRWQKTGGLSMH